MQQLIDLDMDIRPVSHLTDSTKEMVLQLWNLEYPQQLFYKSVDELEAYLDELIDPNHTLVFQGDSVVGWYYDFIREGERWFGLILDEEVQGNGIGAKLLDIAKSKHEVLNGWVVDDNNVTRMDGLPYVSPLMFYLKSGFKPIPERRLQIKDFSALKIQWSREF